MNIKSIIHYTAIVSSIAIIVICFVPWVHYNSINTTFTGMNVTKFSTGVYYGKAGKIIAIFASASLLFTLLPFTILKRANMFVSAFLFAYCIRTYILFTGSLFEGEVVKLAGIYLIIFFSLVMVLCSIFPKINTENIK